LESDRNDIGDSRRGGGEVAVPPKWRENFVPVLIDYDRATETWSVVASFYFCSTWYELGKPPLPYVEYRSRRGGAWERVLLDPKFLGREGNVFTGMSARGESGLLQVDEKKVRSRSTYEPLRKIVSEWNGC
jgi:hypothetical protein